MQVKTKTDCTKFWTLSYIQLNQKFSMFADPDGMKELATKCPKCNHSKTMHMRNPRGEGREKGAIPVLGTCSECRRTNNECKYYMSREFTGRKINK